MEINLDAVEYIIGILASAMLGVSIAIFVLGISSFRADRLQVIAPLLGAFGTLVLALVTVESARQNSELIGKQERQLEEMRKSREQAEIDAERPIAQEVLDQIVQDALRTLEMNIQKLEDEDLHWRGSRLDEVRSKGLPHSTNLSPVRNLRQSDDTLSKWLTRKYPEITGQIEAHNDSIERIEQQCEEFSAIGGEYIRMCFGKGLQSQLQQRDFGFSGMNSDEMEEKLIAMIIVGKEWDLDGDPFMQPRDLIREGSRYSEVRNHRQARQAFENLETRKDQMEEQAKELRQVLEEIKSDLAEEYTIFPNEDVH